MKKRGEIAPKDRPHSADSGNCNKAKTTKLLKV